ncbi:hypothetical protein [Acidimangrovimonas sediminis]|uniref:hypothetical protein n=1 Tax=Acidimangrovimonas sediminis TaxID=2056283 RepID=UPI000C8000FA|nr:hypothetical protein [Acidimangrovimonas sediminis]
MLLYDEPYRGAGLPDTSAPPALPPSATHPAACAVGQKARNPIYLVVLADMVIRMDLTEAIHELHPGAEVLAANTPDEAEARLMPHERLEQAFVSQGPDAYAGSTLETEISRRGASVVLLGDAAEEAPPGRLPVLRRPFNRAVLMSHLRAVTS